MNPLFIKILCICSRSKDKWEKVFKPIDFFLTVSWSLSLERNKNRLGQAMYWREKKKQVAFSVIQECVGLFAQVFPLYCATKSQTSDGKLNQELNQATNQKKYVFFFLFGLKIINFSIYTIWGGKTIEDQSLLESRGLPQSSSYHFTMLIMYSYILIFKKFLISDDREDCMLQ